MLEVTILEALLGSGAPGVKMKREESYLHGCLRAVHPYSEGRGEIVDAIRCSRKPTPYGLFLRVRSNKVEEPDR